MRAFQKILFPVDMSDSCTATAPFVEAMARKYHAAITMLHVLEMPSGLIPDWYGGAVPVIDTTAIWQAETEAAESYLNDQFQGLNVHRVVVQGDAAQTIDDYARENGTGLIMMPTHGYGLFRTLLLGSVTAKVLHDTPCPVWTGVHMEDVPAVSPEFATVMCAVDRTEDSVATMRFAWPAGAGQPRKPLSGARHPGSRNSAGKIFRFRSPALPGARREKDHRPVAGNRGRRRAALPGQRAKYRMWCGTPRWVIAPTAGHWTRTGDAHAGRLRSNVYSIIRDAPCPVISV